MKRRVLMTNSLYSFTVIVHLLAADNGVPDNNRKGLKLIIHPKERKFARKIWVNPPPKKRLYNTSSCMQRFHRCGMSQRKCNISVDAGGPRGYASNPLMQDDNSCLLDLYGKLLPQPLAAPGEEKGYGDEAHRDKS